ncbi:MAG: discoidin domain-containing protein, partial [Micromonosporaceae bacterium]
SRVWDSLYARNVSRNLRHFTFQWSASGNVVIGNDFDSDLNLHGGWERHNLFELNTVTVPYAHRSGNCTTNCGDEGGGGPDDSNWFPIWWGAGKKAVKWSGATGAQNVFFNNAMRKQLTSDTAPYQDYYPDRHRIYQFGWNGTGYQHLDAGGTPIADWAHNEQRDYTGGHGVDASKTDPGESLFLKSVGGTDPSQTRYEAENTDCQGTVDSDHAGYSGSGFCNTTNTTGAYVEWTVTAAKAGRHSLTFGYANGSSANRPLDVRLNGSLIDSNLAFPPTGAWSNWSTVTTVADLAAGTNRIRVTATTSSGAANLDYLDVTAAPAGEDALISRDKPATSSSNESASFTPDKAVDGDTGTRWASAEGSDPQWIRIDLGGVARISRVRLNWEAAYARAYTIGVSTDGATWTSVRTVTGDGGIDDHTNLGVQGRYVRMHGTERGTGYGYSLWEFEVYGSGGGDGGGDVVDVSTPAELNAALDAAEPGQTIRMASGTYHGAFLTQRAGTASAPVTLTGPRDAVLINDGPSGTAPSCPSPTPGWDSGYGLWVANAPYWNLTGFTVADSKKGIVLDNSHHVTIDNVYVHHIEEEGVHFRKSSADGIIRNSRIEQVGLVKPGFGEGVYIGSANSNWGCHGNSGGMDRSDRVQMLDNHIGPNVAAEHIDIKEGTQDGVVRGNTFDGRGLSGQNSADSWVDVKGSNYLLENNTGTFTTPGTFANGYETHNPVSGYGCGNVWRGNDSDLGDVGNYAIYISSTSKCESNPNRVYSSNTVRNARQGLTNVPVTP